MITQVSISNFKSIKEITGLKLKPLTLLTGVNSSGKSNIMEAISFFGQASRLQEIQGRDATVSPTLIFRSSELKNYPTNIENFIAYKKNPRALVNFEINVEPTESLIKEILELLEKARFDKNLLRIFPDKKKTKVNSVGYSSVFRLDRFYMQSILINDKPLLKVYSTKGVTPHTRVFEPDEFSGYEMKGFAENILDENAFKPSSHTTRYFDTFSEIATLVVRYIRNNVRETSYISGERGRIDPEFRIHEHQECVPSWVGPSGQYLVEILSRCLTQKPEKARKIQEWAGKFQLPNIRAGYIGRGVLESNFTDKTLKVDLNSTLAGLGSRQILSIITQIFWSKPGSVIMIEEPEISLHPENQVLLHELFSEAICEGKQIICSTHSPFFVLAISKIVKKKLLELDKIAVYHVEKDKEGTHARYLKLNKQGFIVSGVPSFMKVEEELFQDWSESLEEE